MRRRVHLWRKRNLKFCRLFKNHRKCCKNWNKTILSICRNWKQNSQSNWKNSCKINKNKVNKSAPLLHKPEECMIWSYGAMHLWGGDRMGWVCLILYGSKIPSFLCCRISLIKTVFINCRKNWKRTLKLSNFDIVLVLITLHWKSAIFYNLLYNICL